MRLNLRLSGNTEPVPFDHLHHLTGALHKWLGENELHDGLSLYSFGWLRGGKIRHGALHFPGGAAWRVSFFNLDAGKACLRGMLADSLACYGMHVVEVQVQDPPPFTSGTRFLVDGPVLARAFREDGSRAHLLWDDPAADEALTRTFHTKLRAAGFSDEYLAAQVCFDRRYEKSRTKKAVIKGIAFRASECPVIVEGTPEAVRAAWLFGVGELTGSGFGALI